MTRTLNLVWALILAGGVAAAGFAQDMSSQDETITQNVKATIAQHSALKADVITVETHQGVVTLRGKVDTQVEKKDLESIVQRTAGVKKVINDTSVVKSDGS